MRTFVKLTLLLLISLGFGACEKDDSENPNNMIEVTIKNTEDYSYDFNISGDEEGATIIAQADHFQISELNRDASTNWSVVYQYKPESDFVGSDYVKIEICTGGQGLSCDNVEIIQINFTITE